MERKNIVITGGTSGIGLGLLKYLLEIGNYNIISISRNINSINNIMNLLKTTEEHVLFLKGDIINPKECNDIKKTISKKFTKINGLVNCAGIISKGGIEDETLMNWHNVLNINVSGQFIITKSLLPLLKQCSTASIVNISSVCSLLTCSSIAYSVSKAATDMFTKCLAKELAKYNIRVNSINPGVVPSNLQISANVVDDYSQFLVEMAKAHPLGRVGNVREIAYHIEFLLSDKSNWTTGAIISVDGGRSIS